ncbi:hypothetical protein HGH92_25850 [Chitinophaga varians]|uniref:Uncharacterized protein n=1 Tax=Chitinophaga varians TaxID=2202339 RepID=A0A847S2V0_9BACT|nr:hypothetical protein [Chitinophaga varians]NLR67755.1 hypothetical protein [Chitinophaga varians]
MSFWESGIVSCEKEDITIIVNTSSNGNPGIWTTGAVSYNIINFRT